jgi:hypothetical protein
MKTFLEQIQQSINAGKSVFATIHVDGEEFEITVTEKDIGIIVEYERLIKSVRYGEKK